MWSWLELLRDRIIDARRHPRMAEGKQSALLVANGREHRVRLLDLSEAGAMLEGEVALEADTNVTLRLLDREPLRGQVRWSRDGRIGLRFDEAAQARTEYRDEE